MKQKIINFDDEGRPHGEYVGYYSNGNICEKGQYFHGLEDGCWEGYKVDGSLYYMTKYDRKGNKGGGYISDYSHDGNIIQSCYYENNIMKYRFVCK